MSLFSFFADMRGATRELRRIADAMERWSPPPDTRPSEPLKPEEVTYATDDELAYEELRDEARKLGILDEPEEERS